MKRLHAFLLAFFLNNVSPLHAQEHPAPPEPYLIHCPEPETIAYTQIPHSIHGIFTAECDAVGFWGMDLSVLDPSHMKLAKAEVAVTNDYWSFYCIYAGQNLILNMATNPSSVYSQCHFSDGSAACEGSIETCVLSCPRQP